MHNQKKEEEKKGILKNCTYSGYCINNKDFALSAHRFQKKKKKMTEKFAETNLISNIFLESKRR